MNPKRMEFRFAPYKLVLVVLFSFILGLLAPRTIEMISDSVGYSGWIMYAITFLSLMIIILKSRVWIVRKD